MAKSFLFGFFVFFLSGVAQADRITCENSDYSAIFNRDGTQDRISLEFSVRKDGSEVLRTQCDKDSEVEDVYYDCGMLGSDDLSYLVFLYSNGTPELFAGVLPIKADELQEEVTLTCKIQQLCLIITQV